MIKRFLSLSIFLVFAFSVFSQPAGYYDNASGKTGADLKTALYNIIKGHTERTYSNLWTDFQSTDKKANGKVWDMYSNIEFTFGTNQCGTYSAEGGCYNREHSFPKSWFNEGAPMYTDLFHLYPTDGYVNNRRGNLPFGEVIAPTYTSGNGSKVGTCSYPGYTGSVFEPVDEYKGDFARSYFYMVTRYENVVSGWSTDMLDGSAYPAFTVWAKNMLLEWNQQDPVSQKEIDRNNAVYTIQHNRNPYIDHPEYATAVWGGELQLTFTSSAITSSIQSTAYSYNISAQGPSGSTITITCPTKPTWLTFSNTTAGHATLTGTPSALDLGNNHVILSLTDGTNTIQQDFIIVVSASLPLGFSSAPITDVTQGIEYVYNITAQGPSGTTYTITCPTKPSWLTLQIISNGVAKLSGVSAVSDIGDNDVVLALSDGLSAVNQEFTISVAENTTVPGGTETFTNITAGSSSYSNRTWTGDDGSTWNASLARTDQALNGSAICLKNTANTYIESGNLSGGCGSISFKTIQVFTGTGGTLTLYINGVQVGSPFAYTTTTPHQVASFPSINIASPFVIKLVNSGTARPVIDDITWTGHANVLPSVDNITNSPLNPTTDQSVTISSTITDSDGTIQEAYVMWGTTSGSLTNKISMTFNSGNFLGSIPAISALGTIYYTVSAKDNSGETKTSDESSYVVTQANVLPTISNIVISPLTPLTGQVVTINANISDSDGTIQEAYIMWGTASGNLTSKVSMNLNMGSFKGIIPSQSAIGTVFYTVSAKDNSGETKTSDESSYVVTQANVLPIISNIVINPVNPITGQAVKVSVTIIDSDGTVQEAFAKWGTSSSNLNNQITMILVGDHYEATIPSQSQAGIIYLSLNAKDNLDDVSSELYSYVVAQNQAPVITNISNTPQNPLTGQTVAISASIADADGSVQQAWVKWGTTTLNLDNELPMMLDGTIYKASIPSQSQAGTIYLSVNAKDNLDIISTELYSFVVLQNQAPVITNIVNNPVNPTVGQEIIISSTISDTDGTIQDVWLDWGTTSNNLSNRINMNYLSGSYMATIPAQAQEGTIYLAINAKDNLLATSSTQYSFSVSPTTFVNYDVSNSKVKVYPNPAKNQINVEVQEVKATQISISNIIGELLISMPFNGSKQSIDISRLKSGVYLVVVTGNGFKNTSRIVVY